MTRVWVRNVPERVAAAARELCGSAQGTLRMTSSVKGGPVSTLASA